MAKARKKTKIPHTSENALQKKSSPPQDIIDSTDARIFSVDANYRYTGYNRDHARTMKSLYGVEIELGMSLLEAMTVESDRQTAKANVDRALKGTQVVQEAYSGDAGLSREYFEVSHFPVKSAAGDITGVAVFAKNITERKRTETALIDSQEYLADVLDCIADPVFIKDENHRFSFVNEAGCKLSGRKRAEIIGKTDRDFLPIEQVDAIWKQDDLVLKSGKESTSEERKTYPNVGARAIVTKKTLLTDKAGRKNIVGVVRDITDLKRSEDLVRESGRRYRSLFDNMLEGYAYCQMIFENDRPVDFIYLDVNKAFERLTGLTNVIGRKVSDVVPGIRESNPELLETYGRVAVTGRTQKIESYVDPLKIWFALSVYGMQDRCFVAVFENITERKEATEAIAFQASLLNQVRNAVVATDLGGTVIYWNRYAETLYGWTAKEVIGKPIGTFIVPQQSEDAAATLFESIKNVGHWEGEYFVRRRDGSTFPVQVVDVVIKNDEGAPVGIIGVSIDITERMRAEEALRESENRFRAMFENAAIGIILFDQNRKVSEANASLQKILGYGAEELRGMRYSVFTHSDDAQLDATLFDDIMQGRRTHFHLEKRYLRKDGQTVWVRLTVSGIPGLKGLPEYAIGMVEEISERKAAEAALMAAEEKYRGIFENAAEGMFQIGPDGRFVLVNPAFARILGYESPDAFLCSAPEVEGRLFKEQNDRRLWKKIMEEHGAVEGFEVQLCRNDGSTVWVSENVHAVRGDDGVLRYYEGTAENISERKQMEEALWESEERFRLVFENAFDGLSIFEEADESEEARLVDCNPRYAQMAGRSRKELLTIGTTRHLNRSISDVEREFLLGGVAFRGSFSWDRPDGKDNVIEFTGVPFEMRGKRYTIGIDRDVTERKVAEEKLRRSEEQFRLISENVADMIAVVDVSGKRLYNSPSYTEVLGDPGTLHGTDAFGEIHPEDRDKIKRVFQETVRTGIGQRSEYRFLLKDNTIRDIESQGSVIRGEHGEVANVLIVSRDVTEQKRLEQQFLRAQRMESIGTLASGIAHDLNNVLAPIMMAIELIRMKLSDPEARKWLETIESSAKRGSAIVKQVLAFGRGVKGEQINLQLKHVMTEVVKIAEETFPKSIEIRTDIPRNLWTVIADPTQMQQVLLNVCVNARDAMPHGGILSVSAENVTLDEHYVRMNLDATVGSFVVIAISDTGTGISPEIREKIFDPFFTTKEIGKGTGLGLSTTLGIVKSHKGFIGVYSELGKGTTIKIYLPATGAGPGAEKQENAVELPMGSGELILIIDDEAAVREITRQTLEASGYKALTANDGAEGIAVYAGHIKEFKAVITDMMMPIMDGTAAIRALQKLNPEVRIIAVSGMSASGRTVDSSEAGVRAYLTKPYTAEKLLVTLAKILKDI